MHGASGFTYVVNGKRKPISISIACTHTHIRTQDRERVYVCVCACVEKVYDRAMIGTERSYRFEIDREGEKGSSGAHRGES